MNPDHFAIVFGLAAYTSLGNPPPSNLRGPENDADAIAAWLLDPECGGLLSANIKKVCSRDCLAPPAAAPSRDAIEDSFLWLNKLAEANAATGRARTGGMRLYLYASGHGFSPWVNQGCLLAGSAEDGRFTQNVSLSSWVEWLQDAGYF